MAFTTTSPLLRNLPLRCPVNPPRASSTARASVRPPRPTVLTGRRQWLFALTAATVLKAAAGEQTASAQDIPLFGLRKKLKKVEEEAEEILSEGIETAEKGIKTAEKGLETAEKGIATAEMEIETAASFGGLAQAGAVAGAEAVGVLVATSIVNGILGPEAENP